MSGLQTAGFTFRSPFAAFSALLLVSLSCRAGSLDLQAEKFVAEYTTAKSVDYDHRDWEPQSGPWRNFLSGPITSKLADGERRSYEEAMRSGNCEKVIEWQSVSFLRKHPFLRDAHNDPQISTAFVETVVKKSPDYRYCFWRENYLKVMEEVGKLDAKDVLPLKIKSGTNRGLRTSTVEYDREAGNLMASLCISLEGLATLAVIHDHRPALEDLVRMVQPDAPAKLPPSTELYLMTRADVLGVKYPNSGEWRDQTVHTLKPERRIRIESYAKSRTGSAVIDTIFSCETQ